MDQDINALGEPAGGWSSLKSVTSVLVREHVALAGTRHRQWKTKTGKANFIQPSSLDADPDMQPEG